LFALLEPIGALNKGFTFSSNSSEYIIPSMIPRMVPSRSMMIVSGSVSEEVNACLVSFNPIAIE